MVERPGNPSSSASSRDRTFAATLAAAGARLGSAGPDGIPAAEVERDLWPELARQLRRDPALSYEMLLDVAALDWEGRVPRFEVVYHLWSLSHNRLLRVKVGVPEEDARCPSVVEVWPTADWHEREAFDLLGIRFDGHPDLRRILMPDDYPYHPLRKDFPLEGIDNAVSYQRAGGVLLTDDLVVDRPAGQDPTPTDRSRGDPPGFSDGAEEVGEECR